MVMQFAIQMNLVTKKSLLRNDGMNIFGCKNVTFDFHLHVMPGSPDSKQSVEAAIETAKQAGLETIAITDHNSINSLDEAIELGKKMGVQIVPGCELSSTIFGLGDDLERCNIHVLALGIKNDKTLFDFVLKESHDERKRWERQLKELCESTFGIKMNGNNYYELKDELYERGLFPDKKAAKKWLRMERPDIPEASYVPISNIVDIIHQLGGIAIWAHPNRGENHKVLTIDNIQKVCSFLISKGLDGVELFHPDVISEPPVFELLKDIAIKNNLLVSLGSDRHNAFGAYGEHYFTAHEFLDNSNFDFAKAKNSILEHIKTY